MQLRYAFAGTLTLLMFQIYRHTAAKSNEGLSSNHWPPSPATTPRRSTRRPSVTSPSPRPEGPRLFQASSPSVPTAAPATLLHLLLGAAPLRLQVPRTRAAPQDTQDRASPRAVAPTRYRRRRRQDGQCNDRVMRTGADDWAEPARR
ncbi:hypothetical protein C2E23DRAFT_522328 [Lenzites betulinus]|nr:hypothetical protein C2E23DRAFT_522328 [Lenzites betulinus]